MIQGRTFLVQNNNMFPNGRFPYCRYSCNTININKDDQRRQRLINERPVISSEKLVLRPRFANYANSLKNDKSFNLSDQHRNLVLPKKAITQNGNQFIPVTPIKNILLPNYRTQGQPQLQRRLSLPSLPSSNSNLKKNFNSNSVKIQDSFTSQESYDIISAYASNSCNGIIRGYNEDKIKIFVGYQLNKEEYLNNCYSSPQPKISYFAIYDGHGGEKCSEFLQNTLHKYIFNSPFFPKKPLNAIYEAFHECEKTFDNFAFKDGKLIDKSGSCAIIALIIDSLCYLINLGDSRALFSRNSGKELYQLTRDQKPEDPKEKERILKNGGQVYKADFLEVGGKRIPMKNVNFGPGFKFPYRLIPGKLSVSFYFF